MLMNEYMCLKDLVSEPATTSKGSSPYKSLKSVKVKCVARKEIVKCTEFNFTSDSVTMKKVKTVHYGVADESDVIKVTVDENVLREIGTDMEVNRTYILRNYRLLPARHNNSGQIFRKPTTMVFQTSILNVSDDLARKAEQTINPPSPVVPRYDDTCLHKIVTVQGRVVSVSFIFKILSITKTTHFKCGIVM